MVVAYKKIMSNKRSIEGSLLVTFLPMCLPLVICFLFQVWMNTALELLDSTNGLHMMINTAPSLAEHLFVWYIAVLFNLLLPWNLQRIAVLVRFLQCPDNFFFAFAKPNVNQWSWNNVFSCPLYFLHTVLNEFCQKNTAHSMNPSRYRMDWCFQMSVPTFLHTTVKNSRLQRSLIFSSSSVQETTWLMGPWVVWSGGWQSCPQIGGVGNPWSWRTFPTQPFYNSMTPWSYDSVLGSLSETVPYPVRFLIH